MSDQDFKFADSSQFTFSTPGDPLTFSCSPARSFYMVAAAGGVETCSDCGIAGVVECRVMSTHPGEKPEQVIGKKCLWCGWRKVS
jgi:hypothetical protein